MATDRARRRGTCRALVLGILGSICVFHAASDADPVYVTTKTEVRSIRFSGVRSLRERELRSILVTHAREPAFALRTSLGKLPFIDPPPRHPFRPRVLQEDVVRMRDAYFDAGFLGTQVRYEVRRVGDEDLIDVTFLVEEGQPQRIVDVRIAPADSTVPLPVSDEERKSWDRMRHEVGRLAGNPLNVSDARRARDRIRSWWLDRGYPDASVQAFFDRDSLRAEGRVLFVVRTGEESRLGAVEVSGNRMVSDEVLQRRMAIRTGDTYSASALEQAREDLQRLEIIRHASVQIEPQARTAGAGGVSSIPVRVSVIERKPRLASGEVGYASDGGLSGEARWSHLNFTGGARVLTLSLLAQTGLWALSESPDERYRGDLSLLQPHLFHRRLSGVVGPFAQYREDVDEESFEVGSHFTLVYQLDRFSSLSLDYRISSRRIYEYRFGGLTTGDLDFLSFYQLISQGADSLGDHITTSLATLSSSVSTLDKIADPSRGIWFRPALQVTVPTAWSTESYWRADGTAYGFIPLGRSVVLANRITAGRAFPFGQSLPGPGESTTTAFLRLRDASFTAGGSSDVRGWGYRLLGPKFPDLRFVETGDSLTLEADGYVPLGGLSRVSFSTEIRVPLAFLSRSLGSYVFLDGGRVWTDDTRFGGGSDPLDQERFFYATGTGLDFKTPVGSLRIGIGYKLNPSVLDLVDAGDVVRAIEDGSSIDGIPEHGSRRWHFHVSFGASY